VGRPVKRTPKACAQSGVYFGSGVIEKHEEGSRRARETSDGVAARGPGGAPHLKPKRCSTRTPCQGPASASPRSTEAGSRHGLEEESGAELPELGGTDPAHHGLGRSRRMPGMILTTHQLFWFSSTPGIGFYVEGLSPLRLAHRQAQDPFTSRPMPCSAPTPTTTAVGRPSGSLQASRSACACRTGLRHRGQPCHGPLPDRPVDQCGDQAKGDRN
jgi:hypothetical protein